MSDVHAEQDQKGRQRFWFVLLFAVFAAASFDFLMSVDYVERRERTVEARLEQSVERTEAGNVRRQAVLLLLGAASAISLFKRGRDPLSLNGPLPWLIAFLFAWACLSVLWSYDGALTFRRVVILGILLLSALAAAERFTFRQIMQFAFVSGCAMLVLGLGAELALGMFKPWDAEYRFAGVMNPIFTGAHCGMTAVAGFALARDAKSHRNWYIAAALAALLFMLLTRSRGPAGATAAAMLVYAWMVRPQFRRFAVLGILALAVLLVFPSFRGDTYSTTEGALLFGRQVESSHEWQGRDALWQECLAYAARRPILGYGYDGFWTRDFTFDVTDASGFTSQHTHNAFLDMLLGVGIPGAAAHLLIVLLAMIYLAARYRRTGVPDYAAALALLVLYAIHNMFVSVQLAVQIQTFVVLAIIMKLAFFQKDTDAASA